MVETLFDWSWSDSLQALDSIAIALMEKEPREPLSEQEILAANERAFGNLIHHEAYVALRDEFERALFCDYCMDVRVHRAGPNKVFRQCWRFSVPVEQANQLAGNVVPILRQMCGLFTLPQAEAYVNSEVQ